jgi:hypothetical protein
MKCEAFLDLVFRWSGRRKTAEDLNVSAENAPTCNIEIVEIWMGGSGWGDRNSVFPGGK